MTDLRKAAEMALEALNEVTGWQWSGPMRVMDEVEDSIQALRQALAQPEQEPVAEKQMMRWVELLKRLSDHGKYMKIPSSMTAGDCYELAIELEQFINTAPPKRKWVGLTDEDRAICVQATVNSGDAAQLMRAIEAKLKEKNFKGELDE